MRKEVLSPGAVGARVIGGGGALASLDRDGYLVSQLERRIPDGEDLDLRYDVARWFSG